MDEVSLTSQQFERIMEPLHIMVDRLDAIYELLKAREDRDMMAVRCSTLKPTGPQLGQFPQFPLGMPSEFFIPLSSASSDGDGKNIDSPRE